jgi:lipoprotein-anchoring transpeptidase ErfK/SrfK
VIARRTAVQAALAAGGAGLLTACTGDDSPGGGGGEPEAPPVAKITAKPEDGATGVGVTQDITLTVAQGKLTEVQLTNAAGKQVKGKLAEDGSSWRTSEPLGYGKKYSYTAKAIGDDEKPVELEGSFTTLKPKAEVRATLNPIDDAVVGVGMPISVKFAAPVKDRKAAEKALKVKTTPEVEGSWGWLHDGQVDWRPKEYWPANTEVEVEAKLYGVPYGSGEYGTADVTTKFTIGRNQVVKIHTPDHRMRVYRDGSLHANYPCSNGEDADPDLNSPNGTVIVMTKEPKARFDNARYGYTNVWKKWACRISNHGEYIHENEENRANIGKRNTSHGCTNLFEKDAKAYFDSALIGDPVEISGSKADFPKTSDVWDWLVDWQTWRGMSAL